jgi:hypothetical protein
MRIQGSRAISILAALVLFVAGLLLALSMADGHRGAPDTTVFLTAF